MFYINIKISFYTPFKGWTWEYIFEYIKRWYFYTFITAIITKHNRYDRMFFRLDVWIHVCMCACVFALRGCVVFNNVSVISWWFLLGVGTTFRLIVLPTLRYHPERFMLTHTVALPIQDWASSEGKSSTISIFTLLVWHG